MRPTEKIMLAFSSLALLLLVFILGISQSDTPIPDEGKKRIEFLGSITKNLNPDPNEAKAIFTIEDFNDPKFFQIMSRSLSDNSSTGENPKENIRDENIRKAQLFEQKLIEEKMKRVYLLREELYHRNNRVPASKPSARPSP